MMQPELGTMASPGVARYLVGQNIDGVWTTKTARLKDLHINKDVCLLAQVNGVEMRVPVSETPQLPDDAKIYAQDGSQGDWNDFGEVGYISGAKFKRFMWGKIGEEVIYTDRTKLTDPNTGKKYSHINEDGLSGWMMPGETIEIKMEWDGDAPSGQCNFDFRVHSGPVTLAEGEWGNSQRVTFNGGPGEFATVICTISHKHSQYEPPQSPRLMLMSTATAPWE